MKPMRVVTSAAILSSFARTIFAMAAIAAAPQKQTFTGTITDSICTKADHSQMHMGPTDAACTLACVDVHGAMFVLYDGKNTTYTLSDQKTPRKFAGQNRPASDGNAPATLDGKPHGRSSSGSWRCANSGPIGERISYRCC
jgi:hypothetical protein